MEDWFKASIQAHPRRLWSLFAISVLVQVLAYFTMNEFSFYRGVGYRHIVLSADYRIPFLPGFIYIYATLYLVPLLTFGLFLRHPLLWQFVVGFYLLTSFHYLIFILYPVENILRPLVTGPMSTAVALCQFFYSIDRPYNSFPSMHVSLVFFSAFFLKYARHRAAAPLLVMAFLIFLSTLVTKQHYILDAVVGALVGMGMATGMRRLSD